MAVKTRDDINTQLSTGGSAAKVERDLVKDIVDSFVHQDENGGGGGSSAPSNPLDPSEYTLLSTQALNDTNGYYAELELGALAEEYTRYLVRLRFEDGITPADYPSPFLDGSYQLEAEVVIQDSGGGDKITSVCDSIVYTEGNGSALTLVEQAYDTRYGFNYAPTDGIATTYSSTGTIGIVSENDIGNEIINYKEALFTTATPSYTVWAVNTIIPWGLYVQIKLSGILITNLFVNKSIFVEFYGAQ